VKPTGIAKSLNIGDPAAGLYALEAVRAPAAGWTTPTTTRSATASGCSRARPDLRRDGGGVTTAVVQLIKAGTRPVAGRYLQHGKASDARRDRGFRWVRR
jgi:threonine synthase